MSNHNHQEFDPLEIVGVIAQWLLLVLGGLFIISQWLTKMLFRYLINPATDGLLDRHDGLLVSLSSLLWGLVALLVFPLLVDREALPSQPSEVVQLWLGVAGIGLAWGLAIGFWVLLAWWAEVESYYQPVSDFTQVLDAPPAFYLPEPSDGRGSQERTLSLEELEGLIIGQDANTVK